MASSIDIDGIIRKAVEAAKTEELRGMTEAIKALAEYMRDGFQRVDKRLEEHSRILQEHSRILQEHSRILQEHAKNLGKLVEEIGSLKIMVGSFTSRAGISMEKMVLNLMRKTLFDLRGIEVDKIEKRSFKDEKGYLLQPGQKVEIDIYISDKKKYALEVKSFVEGEDIDWLIARRKFLESRYNLKASWLLVTSAITEEAYTKAAQNEIEVIYGTLIPS
ncbi:MAG: hypothetical protein QXX95_03275 [Nitrososphaerales archaeon]